MFNLNISVEFSIHIQNTLFVGHESIATIQLTTMLKKFIDLTGLCCLCRLYRFIYLRVFVFAKTTSHLAIYKKKLFTKYTNQRAMFDCMSENVFIDKCTTANVSCL